jgi:hypothetical protein
VRAHQGVLQSQLLQAKATIESSCCALRASGQQPASAPPFSARCRAVRFDMCRVDHLRICGSPISGKLPEQVFPDATATRCLSGEAIAPNSVGDSGHSAILR